MATIPVFDGEVGGLGFARTNLRALTFNMMNRVRGTGDQCSAIRKAHDVLHYGEITRIQEAGFDDIQDASYRKYAAILTAESKRIAEQLIAGVWPIPDQHVIEEALVKVDLGQKRNQFQRAFGPLRGRFLNDMPYLLASRICPNCRKRKGNTSSSKYRNCVALSDLGIHLGFCTLKCNERFDHRIASGMIVLPLPVAEVNRLNLRIQIKRERHRARRSR
jgi:hypothetical protein